MKKVLITGASTGIGRQLAIDYAKKGYYVIACARSEQSLNELSEMFPDQVSVVSVDVSSAENVKSKMASLLDIDLVILNAGTCEYLDLDKFESGLFERVYQVNVLGMVYCVEALLSKIVPKGQLALVGSLARLLPFTRAEAYGGSKAAVHYMAKSLAVDVGVMEKKVSVHSISPGFVRTPLTDKNDFDMPFLVSVEEASQRIISGLEKGKRDVSFPRRLAWTLHACALMPESWQEKMCVWMGKKALVGKD